MSAPPLPGVLGSLAPVLNNWGYLAVGGLIVLEDFGIPVPGETVLIAAAVYAGAGRLNVVAVGLIAFAAAVVGDNIGYAIGRFGGHELIERYGRYVLLTPARVQRAEAFFGRHGGKIVTVARFIEGLRQANGIIAGLSRMHWARFLAFNALGAALWVGTWVSIGYFAGSHIGTLYTTITNVGLYLLIAAAVLIAGRIGWHLLRRRRHGRAGDGGRPGDEAAAGEAAQAGQGERTEPDAGEPGGTGQGGRTEPGAGEPGQAGQGERAGPDAGGAAQAEQGERAGRAEQGERAGPAPGGPVHGEGERAGSAPGGPVNGEGERAGPDAGGAAQAGPGGPAAPGSAGPAQTGPGERAEPGPGEPAESKQSER